VPNRAMPSTRQPHRELTWRYLVELHAGAEAIVARHYRRRLTLELVARALASSPRQLQRAYAEVGHTTFAAHLRSVRLRNAAELLAHQPLTVTDVARLVGYRQPSHFVKAFRRRYGMTPGAFRDAARRRAATDARADTRRHDAVCHSDASIGDAPLERALGRRPAATRSRAHRHARVIRSYSKPNSRVVFEAGCEDEDALDEGAEADDAPPEDPPPALAERADGEDDRVGRVEPADPESPSKPNSLRASVADDAFDADSLAAVAADDVAACGRRTWCTIGAGARAAADERDPVDSDGRCESSALTTWWRSRGSGPPKSPTWSQTT
jgi:AraC family transcriptional regulator of adaptative response / methylphosphotriester-DNA alkyltransferase methyltransferase